MFDILLLNEHDRTLFIAVIHMPFSDCVWKVLELDGMSVHVLA